MSSQEITVNAVVNGAARNLKVFAPEKCPLCHHAIEAKIGMQAVATLSPDAKSIAMAQQVFSCPRHACQRLFIGLYFGPHPLQEPSEARLWSKATFVPTSFQARQFEPMITALSPQFDEIYRQAERAEHEGLDAICGPGYRKSLEFLLKDFLKSTRQDASEQEKIDNTQLGPLIRDYVDNTRLKAAALRATWLGNDETHYVRKWKDRDVQDLKTMIDLTVHWIAVEVLTRDLETSMPASGPSKQTDSSK